VGTDVEEALKTAHLPPFLILDSDAA